MIYLPFYSSVETAGTQGEGASVLLILTRVCLAMAEVNGSNFVISVAYSKLGSEPPSMQP